MWKQRQRIEDLITRAYGLYFARAAQLQQIPDQPACSRSEIFTDRSSNRRYVVLRNTYRTLAVYRIKRRGEQYSLKRLRVWPRAISNGHDLDLQSGCLYWA